jgi:large subunit ribosomal protein L22
MEARAVSRYTRIAPRKARIVADLVRGKRVDEAYTILALTPKKASGLLRKIIQSAVANARVVDDGDTAFGDSDLVIKEVRIDEGPMMKRIRPRAQGRAYLVRKRMSHIQVTVAPGS